MASYTLIKNGTLVNEGLTFQADILLKDQFIDKIGTDLSHLTATVIDAAGMLVLPGMIDDQVHFREPGLTHKGNIYTESRAAVAGGVTSYMEQPNTNPQTTSIKALEAKFLLGAQSSFANYAFPFGGTNDNLEELKRLDKNATSNVKLFLGSSTGNMLVDNEQVLEGIFSNTALVICAHCEDEGTIRANMEAYTERYGADIPMSAHPEIRSAEACYLSSSKAVALAERTAARLHVFHLSTARETHLFRNDIPLKDKKITAEVCLHHLWFSDIDYAEKGSYIKWNPAVKTSADRAGLWEALLDDRIDVIATDHAPHTIEEKQQKYAQAPSGGPLVQHALVGLLEKVGQGMISLPNLVQKICHNPAILFNINRRGYLREGYFADLVLIKPNVPWTVSGQNIVSKCGWSPFLGTTFTHQVHKTFVNGHLAYDQGVISDQKNAMRLTYNRD